MLVLRVWPDVANKEANRRSAEFASEANTFDNFCLEMAKKYPKSFDEVWLTTFMGFPKLSVHLEHAVQLREFADKLQAQGKRISLQLATSIGHGDHMGLKYDCSAVETDCDWQPLVGADGVQAKYSWCWNNQNFREYTYKEVALYADIVRPEKFWFDDDFRAANHSPVGFGCFCPNCIRKFNRQYEVNLDREALLEKLFGEELIWRERWVQFIQEGLKSFMRGLCESIYAVAPETEFGLQNGANGAYTGYGHKYLFDEMKAVNGKAPHFRAGGGFYNDHNPNLVLEKAAQIAYQHSFLPYYGVLSPEIECIPNTAYGKSVAGILMETSHYLALGSHDMTYSILSDIEILDWHEEKFESFEKMRPYWEKLSEVSKCTKADGLCYVVSKKAYNKPLKEGGSIERLNAESYLSAYELSRDGFPIVYEDLGDNVCLLHPDVAEILTQEEVEKLKTRKVLTCGESIRILNERGFSIGVKSIAIEETERGAVTEFYEKNPLNGTLRESFLECYYTTGRFSPHILSNLPNAALVLGKYKHNMMQDEAINGKVATAIVPFEEGGQWAIFGYSLWKSVKTIPEHERILNIYDYLANTAPVRLLSTEQVALNIRRDEADFICAVSLTNCSIGVQENLEVFVKKPLARKAVFWGQYHPKQDIIVKEVKDGVVVTIPQLAPWSVGTIFFE